MTLAKLNTSCHRGGRETGIQFGVGYPQHALDKQEGEQLVHYLDKIKLPRNGGKSQGSDFSVEGRGKKETELRF